MTSSSAHRRLWLPGRPKRRLIRQPDLRHLDRPRLSGAVLDPAEVDYDELKSLRSWRTYEADQESTIKYFMYELAQANPGEEFGRYFKAVRFIRLRRVPRYLRQQGSGVGRPGVGQMAYVLAGLRESGVLFLQMIAKTPEVPLVYSYGVQAIGDTIEEAQAKCDEAHSSLCALLDGTFQQIEYSSLTMKEGESLVRSSSTWDQIAVARGRPMPTGEAIGASALLDGNRTDMETTHNQMEAFLRGMSERHEGFMLNMISVPVPVEAMTLAWRNITEKLSATASEVHGAKSFNFGAALPLALGSGAGAGTSDSHSSSSGHGESLADAVSTSNGISAGQSLTDSLSASQTAAASQSISEGVSQSQTLGTSSSFAEGLTSSESESQSVSQSVSESSSESLGQSTTQSQSVGSTQGVSESLSVSESVGLSESSSTSQSVGQSQSVGSTLGSTASSSEGASLSNGQSLSQSIANSLSQSVSLSDALAESLSTGTSLSEQAGINGGLFGIGGSQSEGEGTTESAGVSNTNTVGTGLSGGSTDTVGIGSSQTSGLSATVGSSESIGVTDSRGVSESLSLGQSLAATQTQATAQGAGFSQAASSSQGLSQGASFTQGLATGSTAASGAGVSQGTAVSQTAATGTSTADTLGANRSASAGLSQSETSGVGRSVGQSLTQSQTLGQSSSAGANRAVADAYMVGMSRQATSSGSFGVAPTMGVSVSKQTLDAGKRTVASIMEETMKRYIDGLEGGAYMYQLFFVAPDNLTLKAGAALLKSAFWGPGNANDRLGQPFHIITDFEDEEEKRRLLEHARAFTSYRRREPSIELIEPFLYSSYITVNEMSAFARPPAAENLGLLAVHDSAPVMAMPDDRHSRDVSLGYVFNGERGRTSQMKWGFDIDEITHMLVAGETGSGKTTTLNRMLSELVNVERTVVDPVSPSNPVPQSKTVGASILAIDWMKNMRHLGSLVENVKIDPATGEKTGRFQFFSVRDERLGAFRWNPFAVPSGMSAVEWMNAMADNMVASWNLGEFGRSLIAEYTDRLYRANRLEPFVLRPEKTVESTGQILRPAIVLEAIDPETLPAGAIGVDEVTGEPVANVFTHTDLSRLIGVQHLAVIVAAELEAAATVEGGRAGTSVRDRLQSLWRRVSYFAPGGQMEDLISFDESLDSRFALTIEDLVDPDKGLVTVIETDGLDLANRRFILGSVLLAAYRSGLQHGEGHFNQQGRGPGLFIVLEEAHELFGGQGEDEDSFSASTRTALYESMHRRIRALGAHLVDVVQNCGDIPESITSNVGSVIVHRSTSRADRERIFSLLNWSNQIGQQLREFRYLGELPRGHLIARLSPIHHYLEAAPCNVVCEPAALGRVTDDHLAFWASQRT